jgi:DNA-binding transcriptional ArsR family regulator
MVESLDAVFHALSSEPRREMLGALAEGDRTVGDLAAPFDISLAAISKHLKVLEGAGLVERRVEGRTTVCRLRAEPLAGVREWVDFYERFWDARLDRLKRLLEEDGE